MKNTVVTFAQPDGKLPHPPTSPAITLRRSIGLIIDLEEIVSDMMFHQDNCTAGFYQTEVMHLAWRQTPAGSLMNDLELIFQMVKRRIADPNHHQRRDFFRNRAGIMRGWYLCSDDRLYHPFVAHQVERCWKSRKGTVQPGQEI
jgi:hypothetical protein